MMNNLDIAQCLNQVKKINPLTLSITNQVTINECANGLLAIGASPVMSDDPHDAECLAALAAATVLNIGTVSERQFVVMLAAGQSAKISQRPVIFDPVGAGATIARKNYSSSIITQLKPDIIRGNYSEIKALGGLTSGQKGVDSVEADDFEKVADAAEALAQSLDCVVAVTGATDVVSTGRKTYFIGGGNVLLTKLTGTGCLLSAMVGAYAGANNDLAISTVAAMAHMAVAGAQAADELENSRCLGTFRVKLFDKLALISGDELIKNAEVRVR